MKCPANLEFIVKTFDYPQKATVEPLLSYHIESTPNGQSYGTPGHIPCNHVAVFEYASNTVRFDGTAWTTHPNAVKGC